MKIITSKLIDSIVDIDMYNKHYNYLPVFTCIIYMFIYMQAYSPV